MKLSQLSILCMLSSAVFDNFAPDQGFMVQMPLWIQWLFMSLLVVIPGIGAVAGVMSWRRERHTGCFAIAVIVLNVLLALGGALRLFWFSLAGS